MLKTKVIEKIRPSKKIQELFNSNRLNYTSVNGYIQIIERTNIKQVFPVIYKLNNLTIYEFPKEYAKKLQDANNKTDNLNDKTKVIEDIVNNLKPASIVKNTHLISSNEIEKINDYIKDVKSTNKSIKSVNNLNYIMDKYEQDINTHENIVNELNNNLNDKDKLINELTDKLNKANENNEKNITKINSLTLQLNNLKRLWRKFIDFLTDKILFKMDKSYIKFVDELFDNKVITESEKNHIKTGSGLKVKERNNDYER